MATQLTQSPHDRGRQTGRRWAGNIVCKVCVWLWMCGRKRNREVGRGMMMRFYPCVLLWWYYCGVTEGLPLVFSHPCILSPCHSEFSSSLFLSFHFSEFPLVSFHLLPSSLCFFPPLLFFFYSLSACLFSSHLLSTVTLVPFVSSHVLCFSLFSFLPFPVFLSVPFSPISSNFLVFCISFPPVSFPLHLMFTHLPIHLTNVCLCCKFTSGCTADSQKRRRWWETCPLNGSLFSPSRLPLQHTHENLIHSLCIYHMLPTYLPQMLASDSEWCAGTAPRELQTSALNGSLYSGPAFSMMDAVLF